MLPFIAPLIGNVFGMVGDHFKQKREMKAAKARAQQEVMIAKAKHVIQKAETDQNADIKWEMANIDQSGWKDEFWTIVLAAPFILGFIPGMVDYVTAGFIAFSNAPTWYQNILVVVICAPFGVRVVGRGADVLKKSLTK